MHITEERKQEQETWHAMTTKVPEHAPWATYGYTRLMEQYAIADSLMRVLEGTNCIPEELTNLYHLTLSNLNAAITTMRPGNLAELEDLDKLILLINQAKQQSHRNNKLQKAIDYADMVVRYVSDGSGTHDMIQRATALLTNIFSE